MKTKYVAIDIETTGTDWTKRQILEFAAVIETDWVTPVEELPTLHLLIDPGEVSGDPVALAMNARLIRKLAESKDRFQTHKKASSIGHEFNWFLNRNDVISDRITVAGKNFATFDQRFLESLGDFPIDRLSHRVIDVGPLWLDPAVDEGVPNTATCLKRAGLPDDVQHDAVEDCRNVIRLIRAAYARDRDSSKRDAVDVDETEEDEEPDGVTQIGLIAAICDDLDSMQPGISMDPSQLNAVVAAANTIMTALGKTCIVPSTAFLTSPPVPSPTPVPVPTLEILYLTWLESGDTGQSSKYLARHLVVPAGLGFVSGVGVSDCRPHAPCDAADIGRCIRMLDAIPELRPHLVPTMTELMHGHAWNAIARNWDQLETWYKDEPTGKSYRINRWLFTIHNQEHVQNP